MENYVEYRPHYLSKNGEEKYFGSPKLDSDEVQNIIHVLEYHGERYKLDEDGRVLIPSNLAKDWELVWNYTSKANDPYWLSRNRND